MTNVPDRLAFSPHAPPSEKKTSFEKGKKYGGQKDWRLEGKMLGVIDPLPSFAKRQE